MQELSKTDAARLQQPVAYGKARMAWEQARKRVRADLEALAQAILEASRAEADYHEIADGCEVLYHKLDELDERLLVELDGALSAVEEPVRLRFHTRAQDVIGEYRAFVDRDELVNAIDNNGFRPLQVKPALSTVIAAIARTLG